MSDINQIVSNLKEEITRTNPSSARIITQLNDLRSNEKYQPLSDTEFYDVVGDTFTLNPKFFMASIYPNYPNIRSLEMAKYIVEKFCLYNGEQILYEFQGDIKQLEGVGGTGGTVFVTGGNIFVTNYRIIAQGSIKAKGGHNLNALIFGGYLMWNLSGGSKRAESKESLIDGSTKQKLPCYGYQFKRKNFFELKKKSNGVKYIVYSDDVQNTSGASKFKQRKNLMKDMKFITIKLPTGLIDELYELLMKEDVDQIVEKFRAILVMGKVVRKSFLKELHSLWELKKDDYLSDSEKLDVVLGVYELDPELFMKSIYSEMKTWNFPAFLNIKDELFEKLLNKEK